MNEMNPNFPHPKKLSSQAGLDAVFEALNLSTDVEKGFSPNLCALLCELTHPSNDLQLLNITRAEANVYGIALKDPESECPDHEFSTEDLTPLFDSLTRHLKKHYPSNAEFEFVFLKVKQEEIAKCYQRSLEAVARSWAAEQEHINDMADRQNQMPEC